MDNNLDYICFLNNLLAERKVRNSRYSLRAMARDLEIDPSDLVRVLKGQKKVTPAMANKIALKLGYNDLELLAFLRPSLQ